MLEIELGMYALNSMNVDCWFSFHYLYATGQRIISHLETSLTSFFFFHFYLLCKRRVGQSEKRFRNLLRLKFLEGPLNPFLRGTRAGNGEGVKYTFTSF